MANALFENLDQKKSPTAKRSFAPVEDIDLDKLSESKPKKAKTGKKTVKKTTTDKTKTESARKPKPAATQKTAPLINSIVVEGRDTTVPKSFTISRSNLAKLDRLTKAGLFKNNSRALNAILDAVDVDSLIG